MISASARPANALSFSNFRYFIGMRLPAALGIQMQSVAVGWQVYSLTHRPISLGYVGLAQFLPMLGFALIAGACRGPFRSGGASSWGASRCN